MTIDLPTQVPTQITVPDALVTGAKLYVGFVAVMFVVVTCFIVSVAVSIFRSRSRSRPWQ